LLVYNRIGYGRAKRYFSPRKLLSFAGRIFWQLALRPLLSQRDCFIDSRSRRKSLLIIHSHLRLEELDASSIDDKTIHFLSSMYLSHRFDLLGSGWVRNSFEAIPLGIEDYAYNLGIKIETRNSQGRWLKQVVRPAYWKRSSRIWRLVDDKYIPIDWQLDFKSGYRWSAKQWYMNQDIGGNPGADIKVPWELSRLQHLPQLAAFAIRIPEVRNQLAAEYKNQVLDFIAANPPRMGANWRCTMDVAIRIVNIIIAYDIFSQLDVNKILDSSFRRILSASIFDHGKHIFGNLERNNDNTTNHYLANIAGLLFVSAYLGSSNVTDHWFAFSAMELIKEADKQFNTDGSNFEASTSYHRLSGEMLVYSISLLIGTEPYRIEAVIHNVPKFANWIADLRSSCGEKEGNYLSLPNSFLRKIRAAAAFTTAITKPTGQVVQIGDNDSGRFLKFTPIGEFITNKAAEEKYWNLKGYNELLNKCHFDKEDGLYWDEDMLNHSPFVSAIAGLFGRSVLGHMPICPFEESITKSLSKNVRFSISLDENGLKPKIGGQVSINPQWHCRETIMNFPGIGNLLEGKKLQIFPDFGLIVFQSKRVHLTIMAGPVGQSGYGGHAHNDKLSFDLNVDGKDIVVDPGTFLYTAFPSMRNIFRSTRVHNTIQVNGIEQCKWLEGHNGLFWLYSGNLSSGISITGNSTITLSCSYANIEHIRIFQLKENSIIISDIVNHPFAAMLNRNMICSNGYGKILKTRAEKPYGREINTNNFVLLLPRE